MSIVTKPHSLTCDQCGSDTFVRIKRHWWTRIIYPDSRRYACFYCEKSFLVRNTKNNSEKKEKA